MNIPFITPQPQSFVSGKEAPSNLPRRKLRRLRQADSRATAKRSRRTAFLQAQHARHAQENLLGIARVFFGSAENPEMFINVVRHVRGLARDHAKQSDISYEKAFGEVEGALRDILIARDGDPRDLEDVA